MKKIYIILFSLVLVFSLITHTSALNQKLSDNITQVNTTNNSFNKISEAGNYVRECLVNRQSSTTFEFVTDISDGNKAIIKIMDETYKHTGNPKEGDYLKMHTGYTSSFTGKKIDSLYSYTIHLDFILYTTAEEEKIVDQKVEKILNDLNISKRTTEDKIIKIYDYIVGHVKYDWEHYLNNQDYLYMYTAYAALVNGTAVCQGYSSLLYRLLLEAGIDSRIILGYAGESHSWNIIKLNGKYYNADVTWENVCDGYIYLLKSNADFPNHTRDAYYSTTEFNQKYPMSSSSYLFSDTTGKTKDFTYKKVSGEIEIIKYIGDDKKVYVPAKIDGCPVTTICEQSFNGCKTIEEVILPDSITYIGQAAFCLSQLKTISIGPNVNYLHFSAFQEVDTLETIHISPGNKMFFSDDGAVYSREYNSLMIYPIAKKETTYKVIEGIDNLESTLFLNNKYLKKLILPASLTTIHTAAFQDCNIEEISVDKNNPVLCSVNGVVYSKDMKTLQNYPTGKRDKKFVIPSTVEKIGRSSGYDYVFDKCKYLEEVVIPSSVKELNSAFWCSTSLKTVKFDENCQIKSLPKSCFQGCTALEEIALPKSIETFSSGLWGNEFMDCSNLRRLYIPKESKLYQCNYFGEQVFEGCGNLIVYGYSKNHAITNLVDRYKRLLISYVDMTNYAGHFTDVPISKWYSKDVVKASEIGLMSGTSYLVFSPDQPMSRSMVAAVLHRMDDSPKVTFVKKFKDISSNLWYSNAITWASNVKVVNGYNDGTFKPNNNVTREQLAVMICNYARYKGKYKDVNVNLSKYKDGKNVSSYAKDAIEWCISNGIMSGKENGTRIDPQGNATRAECSKMLLNLYNLIY